MNLHTTFNHAVVAPFCKPSERERKAAAVANHPLFVMEAHADIGAEAMEQLKLANLQELMPFPDIRVYVRTVFGSAISSQNEWLLVIYSKPDELRVFCVCHSVTDKLTGETKVSKSNTGVGFIIHNTLESKRAFYVDGEPVEPKVFSSQRDLDQYDQAARSALFAFLTNLMNPHMHKASVRPNKKGKSVEWTRQRTHFVFIHKSHKANSASFVGKADLESDHILRMAHSRRAHYRILRHPKYKHKVGLKIRVKSCWVGPKEWQGNSGQIYRIVE
jgi:hypothetical protein